MSKLVPAGWLRTGDILVARRLAVRLVLALTAALQGLVVTRSAVAQSDLAGFAPPGRMIVIDGHQVHLHCIAADAPTVILEEGAGGASLNWAWIQWDVAKTTRVCSYDRPGYAWSDPTDTPRDADTVSRELDPLLKSAGEKGPFIARRPFPRRCLCAHVYRPATQECRRSGSRRCDESLCNGRRRTAADQERRCCVLHRVEQNPLSNRRPYRIDPGHVGH